MNNPQFNVDMPLVGLVQRLVRRMLGLRWKNHLGPFPDDVWGQVERAFADKISDASPIHALNRIARIHASRMGIAAPPWLDRQSCSATLHNWDIAAFKDVFRIHNKCRPRNKNGKVIVVLHNNKYLLVDGTNRINYFESNCVTKNIPVILISPIIRVAEDST